MSTCPSRGEIFSDAGENCSNCGATINLPATAAATSQPQVPSQEPPTPPNASSSGDMALRLEKAMRRAELLSYAVAGLAVAILAAIIGIAFV
jgi:hypothetical protein